MQFIQLFPQKPPRFSGVKKKGLIFLQDWERFMRTFVSVPEEQDLIYAFLQSMPSTIKTKLEQYINSERILRKTVTYKKLVEATHIKGKNNEIADWLSKFST